MMGNEGSHLSGLEIDERVVEVTDGWTLHSGTVSGGNNPNISVFISEVLSGGGGNAVILERAAKNLMLYRHPCILKFISSWNKSGRIHLATEEVKPLASVLASQTPLQICIGLHSILKALVFLHEKAASSHNNVCCAAIYVTPDGTWKLGGLEYLCRFTDLTPSYLEETRARRYEKAVPPEEDSMKSSTDAIAHPMSIDQYGFGVLVEEVLHKKSDSDIPALQDFREICKKQLQSSEPSLRPKLASLLDHIFFTHKFITIHSFLAELPLKSEADKNDFFRSLMDQLTGFPENLVAMQLGALLLSRMVLLDATAQEILLPRVLCPKQENGENAGLFSLATYKEYVIPRLLQMFCVRDAQIRLLLLAHFSSFCHSFSEEQLRTLVLPELLVGIKDTNEQLVSVTLRALADLVPVLGAAAVIGGKRAKLFTDGRPKIHIMYSVTHRSGVQLENGSQFCHISAACGTPITQVKWVGIGYTQARHHISNSLKAPKSPYRVLSTPALALAADTDSTSFAADLPERPSPDGGEDRIPTSDDETEAWSDWDVPDNTFSRKMTERIEQRYCIKFCQKLGDSQSQTIRRIQQVFGEDAMGVTQIKEWFNHSKMAAHQRREIAKEVGVSKDSAHAILRDDLNMNQVAAKFVPKLLSLEQKDLCRDVAQDLLDTANIDPGFLNTVITGGESWEYGYDPETKRQRRNGSIPSLQGRRKRQVRSKIKLSIEAAVKVDSLVDDDVPEPVSPQDRVHIEMIPSNKQELDISQLDIKNSVASITSREEFDFFQDMEPVISKTHILQIDEQELDSSDSIQKISKHKFDVNYTAGDGEGDGWGDDLEDWGDVPEGNTPTNV
ncbi:hypothetical protein ANN_27221 [Periplaneta americana]|uniref:Mos1 transposase HTH domain-containing protein n=1 Tax=Periplaneta americana TaxID=6978 RepID=A0ABQ8RXQ5_PERAM|nr:hypothetical protein ANN_27221 [Periplaneta americana]